jgi:hypothetical protein
MSMSMLKSCFKGLLVLSLPVVLVPASATGASTAAATEVRFLGAVSTLTPILPPHNPAQSLAPDPNFLTNSNCANSSDSAKCNMAVLSAISHARKVQEAMGGMHFSLTAYLKLSKIDQLFVTANLERIERGLRPATMLTKSLDSIARIGALKDTDPNIYAVPSKLPGGGSVVAVGANWAMGYQNPLGSDYGWMYDDGLNSPNYTCTRAHPQGCWGHRDNILKTWVTKSKCVNGWHTSQFRTVMGAGYVAHSTGGRDSETELFVGVCGSAPTDHVIRWSYLKKLLGAH